LDSPRHVRAISAQARSVAAPLRRRLADALPGAVPPGSVVLITCHRVEAYVPDNGNAGELRHLVPEGARILEGRDAVRHIASVAVGRDSVVLGEDEILHQLRAALASARREGPVHPTVDQVLTRALQAGRRSRSWQQGRRRSLGDVAVAAIERTHGSIAGRGVLVVGAGRMGSLAARSAVHAGAHVTVASRSQEHAIRLAEAVGARAVSLQGGLPGRELIGVIVALSGPWPMTESDAVRLVGGRAIVVDLSDPAALPAGVADGLGPRLVSADQIAMDGDADHPASSRLTRRMELLMDAVVEDVEAWIAAADTRSAAGALVRRADRARAIELDALWRRLPGLDADARAAIDGMTRHLAARLLQQPLEGLGPDRHGHDGHPARDAAAR
jgi:glutamyl-tRNA reductase